MVEEGFTVCRAAPEAADGRMTIRNPWLLAGGLLSGAAALMHFAIIVGGPAWYRFFGAGEQMAQLAEVDPLRPALITLGIAALLGIWSAYAFSGAGLIRRLPLRRLALLAITLAYLARAALLPLMLHIMADRSTIFLIWSSVIVLIYGLVHAVGLVRGWRDLA